jgi:DNA-binding beta-propeller fold protein YncE
MLRNFLLLVILSCILSNFAWGADPIVYVINSLGETLSKIDLKTDVVKNDVLTLGSASGCGPNQIVVRDTLAYVVHSLTSEIQIIDLRAETSVGYIDMGENRNPFWMAFSDLDTQYAWITCSAVDSLFRVDLINKNLVAGYLIGVWPEGILILDGSAYVCITAFDMGNYTYGQGKVVVFDTRTNSITKEFNVGTNPQYITLDNEGEIYVSCTGDFWSTWGIIYTIDPASNAIKDSIPIGGSPGQIAVSADDLGWLAAGGWGTEGLVYLFDSRSDTIISGSQNPLSVPDDPGIISLVGLQDSAILACAFQADELVKIDASSGLVLKRYQVGDGPVHLDIGYASGQTSSVFISDVEEETDIKLLTLFQNYPNPFNSTTLIRFGLSSRSRVKIEIFNILGQRIRTLVEEELGVGCKEVSWDGKDDQGLQSPSGIYFCKIRGGKSYQSRKMLLLK